MIPAWRRGAGTWLALAGFVMGAATAHAQPSGATSGRTPATVRVSTDVFGGWDVSLTPNTDLATAPGRRDVTYGGANAGLSYAKAFRHVAFTAGANASARYSPRFTDDLLPFYGASISLSSVNATKWSWSLAQNVGYGRQNAGGLFAGGFGGSFGGFGGGGIGGLGGMGGGIGLGRSGVGLGLPTTSVDYQLAGVDALTSNSSAMVGFGLSRRDRINLGANAGTVFNLDGEQAQFLRVGGFANYTRQVTRYTGLVAGYNYFENHALGDTPSSDYRQQISSVNLGVSYARPLPFSRETFIALNTGIAGTPRRDGWFYTAVGSGGLSRDLGRTWRGQLVAMRAIQFVPAFPEPTLINAVSAGLTGNLSRKLTASMSGNYSVGESGFQVTPVEFDAYSASVQMRYAVFRLAGFFTEYYYFLASLRGAVPTDYPAGELSRHGVRVGLSFGTELLGGRR